MNRSTLLIITALALSLTVAAPEARAQAGPDEPVATETVLSLSGGGTVEGDTLYLPLGETVELRVEALDQFGRRFPQERLRFEFDLDRNCQGLVELVDASDDSVTLRTGEDPGSCDVLSWLPNNMNADRRLRIVGNRDGRAGSGVAIRPAPGTIDTREELVAASLFRAVLGRDPDQEWLAGAAEQVRRNQSREAIRSLLASQEFRERRQNRSPEDLLRDFYQGLLGREPDPSGAHRYRGAMHEGRYEDVIRDILDSSEFRDRLTREIRRR